MGAFTNTFSNGVVQLGSNLAHVLLDENNQPILDENHQRITENNTITPE